MKTCPKCGGEFPATTEFWHRNSRAKDGLYSRCKPCERKRGVEKSSRLVIDPQTGETVTANALSSRKGRITLESREKHRKTSQEAQRRLVTDQVTGEIIKAGALSSRKRYRNGKWQEYLGNNPLAKLRRRLFGRIYTAMQKRGWSKTTKTQALVGCDFEFLLEHLKSTLPDWESHSVIHIDHILPCSIAETAEELEALQHWTNLQWLPGPENLSKGAALPPDWESQKQKLMERLTA